MAISYWSIYKLASDNITYNLDGTIPRPNQDLETEFTSTRQKVALANGASAFVSPETKSVKQPFTMFFADTTAALRTQLQGYIDSDNTVKIVTHTAENLIGKFTSMKRVWLTGVEPDSYDVQVVLDWVS
jgi:hypothetical protein